VQLARFIYTAFGDDRVIHANANEAFVWHHGSLADALRCDAYCTMCMP
jgi:hypothetical protein